MYYHVFHWWQRTFEDSWFVLQNLYIRKVTRFWQSWRQFSNRYVKGSEAQTRPTPVCYDLSVFRVSNSQLYPTPPTPSRETEKKDATKLNFSSCSDHSWIINDWYIFFPYLRVWVFLFLPTSFFIAQNVGPMVQIYHNFEIPIKPSNVCYFHVYWFINFFRIILLKMLFFYGYHQKKLFKNSLKWQIYQTIKEFKLLVFVDNIWERRKNLLTEAKLWKKTNAVWLGTVRPLRGLLGRITRIRLWKLQQSLMTILWTQFSQKR